MITGPKETGWMPLKEWAEMTGTPWPKALAYANPNSKRTGKMFHAADVDRRSNQDIKVWYQPPHPVTGFRRPRYVKRPNPSGADSTGALDTSAPAPGNPSHAQATAGSHPGSGHSSPHGSAGAGA